MYVVYLNYSKDCVHWGLLPPATEEMKAKAKLAKGRFTGDPSYEFEHIDIKKSGEGEETVEEEESVSFLFKHVLCCGTLNRTYYFTKDMYITPIARWKLLNLFKCFNFWQPPTENISVTNVFNAGQ